MWRRFHTESFVPHRVWRGSTSRCRSGAAIRALIVNTGYANAGTGKTGLAAARQTCAEVARALGCASAQVLPFSTGVIMEPLPVDRIAAGLPECLADLSGDNWFAAAHAIMTTDTVPKASSRRVTVGRRGSGERHRKGRRVIHHTW